MAEMDKAVYEKWDRMMERYRFLQRGKMTLGEAQTYWDAPPHACACIGGVECCAARYPVANDLKRGAHIVAKLMQAAVDKEDPALRELHHKQQRAERLAAFLRRQLIRQENIASKAVHDIHYLPCSTKGWTMMELRVHLNVVHNYFTLGSSREQLEKAHRHMHQYTEPKMPLLSTRGGEHGVDNGAVQQHRPEDAGADQDPQ